MPAISFSMPEGEPEAMKPERQQEDMPTPVDMVFAVFV